jgi:hypothetical protein
LGCELKNTANVYKYAEGQVILWLLANSYFEVLSDCHQIQNFGQTFLAFLLFA